MKEVLLTGGLGFIGRNVCSKLLQENATIHLLVRPDKTIPEYTKNEQVNPIFIDLEDSDRLQKQIAHLHFDTVFHIGAIRGGRNFSHEIYKKVNVDATAILANISLQKSAKFIYCSSVGVFGAIPEELPPTETTEKQRDNYYHYTKILAEETLRKLKDNGLRFVIIRPSITYGLDDFGFPYSLIDLVNKGMFLNCTSSVKVTMGDVQTLTEAFINAAKYEVENGSAYNICDKTPVELRQLVDFISQQLFQTNYPRIKTLPTFLFRLGEFIFDKIVQNELWKARFQLISNSWYYDPEPAARDLKIFPKETIPNFKYVIDWYKNYSEKKG